MGKWLSYAADEVPKLLEAGTAQLKSAQNPAVFDFSKTDTFVLQ